MNEDEDFDPGLLDEDEDHGEIVGGDDDEVVVQSQADYTRMTQDVAAKRKALAAERDAIANERAQLEQLRAQAIQDEEADLDPDERLARQIADTQQRLAVMEFTRVVETEIREFNSTAKTALNTTVEAVAKYMNENGVSKPAVALKLMALDAGISPAAKSAQRDSAVTEAKRRLGVVGASSPKGQESTPRPSSIRDAFALAKQGVRVSD